MNFSRFSIFVLAFNVSSLTNFYLFIANVCARACVFVCGVIRKFKYMRFVTLIDMHVQCTMFTHTHNTFNILNRQPQRINAFLFQIETFHTVASF